MSRTRIVVEWTKPYCGMSYIKKKPTTPQYALCERTDFVEATVSRTHEKVFRGPDRVAKAKAWLAKMYRMEVSARVPPSSSSPCCPTCGRPY